MADKTSKLRVQLVLMLHTLSYLILYYCMESESRYMGIPKPRKIKDMRKKVMIDFVSDGTGNHAPIVCCLNR